MKIALDFIGGEKMSKLQNDFMHYADVFENSKQYGNYEQLEISTTDIDLTKLCSVINKSIEAAGGYAILLAINSVDGVRCENPNAIFKKNVNSISMLQNGKLGWCLFKDILTKLGYQCETNDRMEVEKIYR